MILNHHTPASFGLLALWYLSLAGGAVVLFSAAAVFISLLGPTTTSEEVAQRFAAFALVAVPALIAGARFYWAKHFSNIVRNAKSTRLTNTFRTAQTPPIPEAFSSWRMGHVTALQTHLQSDPAFLKALAQQLLVHGFADRLHDQKFLLQLADTLKERSAVPPPPIPRSPGQFQGPSYAERLTPRRKAVTRPRVLHKQPQSEPANES